MFLLLGFQTIFLILILVRVFNLHYFESWVTFLAERWLVFIFWQMIQNDRFIGLWALLFKILFYYPILIFWITFFFSVSFVYLFRVVLMPYFIDKLLNFQPRRLFWLFSFHSNSIYLLYINLIKAKSESYH